jgi:adenine-specific DNA-methyltransferase
MSIKSELFIKTFENAFEIGQYKTFAKEFFNNIEWVRPDKFMEDGWNWSEFSFHIKGYYYLANFTGNDKSKIAVFAVEMKNYKNIDKSRNVQRNFIKKLMVAGGIDAAIVAFYAEGEGKWRLSFIKLDYEFAKGRVTEKLTPAKRYSYLVGEGEPCHTAMERLYPIFMNEKTNPTIEEIEEAFSVEIVTKEFFEKYKEKYLRLKEHLDANDDFVAEAERLHFTSEQFAKKLMGQLAFLYFVQKKGWLGVNAFPKTISASEYKRAFFSHGKASREVLPKVYRQTAEDEYTRAGSIIDQLPVNEQEVLAASVKGQPWGTGPKNFIRELFNVCINRPDSNFFDDYLEPLFYEALNEKRAANDYYSKLKCRVPFLNGGLFEPIDNYDWNSNDFKIPNEMFSNIHIKGKEDADGILDIFDRYNFTMNEDEPLEKEVAVDPEMLGKIFENLLDVKDRKSKGAFYTPREIVHYMCQESLINYLVNETGISYDALKEFIVYGEFFADEDTNHFVKKGEEDTVISKEIFDRKNNVNRLKDIDDALANIKVADPAVGSGAFPLGMLSEIVKARRNITEYFEMLSENNWQKKMLHDSERHPLFLKLHTIKNSIFAVDIEPSAVDITKLRLWLSLVVEQETDENAEDEGIFAISRNPRPLPNLDCNIRCGNSLIDELDGVKLVNESDLFGNSKGGQIIIGQNQYDSLLTQLFEAQDKLFYEKNHNTKEELKRKIRLIIDRIVMFNLAQAKPEIIKHYNETKDAPSLPYFLWKLEFAKVFKEKGGFDVVIGNPPYLRIQGIQQVTPDLAELYKKNFVTATGSFDLYVLFVEKGLALLNGNGVLNFIMPHKWINSSFGKGLRTLLAQGRKMQKMISFGAYQVFNASTYTALTWMSNRNVDTFLYYEFECNMNSNTQLQNNIFGLKHDDFATVDNTTLSGDIWALSNGKIIRIIDKLRTQPYMIKNVFSKIFQGIATSKDSVYFLENCIVNENYIEGFSNEIGKTVKVEVGLAKPLLKGFQLHRYDSLSTNMYTIVPYKLVDTGNKVQAVLYTEHELAKLYPSGYEYLKECEAVLRNRENGKLLHDEYWYRYIYPKNLNLFERKKIITPEISLGCNMTIDDGIFYHNTKAYSLVKRDDVTESYEYYLAILNSKVLWFYLQNTGYVLRGGYFTFKTNYLEQFPLPKPPKSFIKEKMEQLVTQILNSKKAELTADTSGLEGEIDKLVYELYGLTEEEIKIVEGA